MKLYISILLFILVGFGIWLASRDSSDPDNKIEAPRSDLAAKPTLNPDTVNASADEAGVKSASASNTGAVQSVAVFDEEFQVRVYSEDPLASITPFHDEPIATYYDWLAEAASAGDTNAALELGFVLMRCVGYATTEDELNKKVSRMHQTHLVDDPSKQEPRFVDDIQPYIDLEQQRYEICKGLSDEQVMGSDEWFELAAELGNYFAQAGATERALRQYWLSHGLDDGVETFNDIVRQVRLFADQEPERLRQSIDHLRKARERGSLQALRDLAFLYSANVIEPENAYSTTANAYANLRAASEVWQEIWGPGSYTYKDDLHKMSEMLGTYELAWAERQARTILREANCCRNP